LPWEPDPCGRTSCISSTGCPIPPDKGDRIRAYHLLRFLSRRAAVHLACLADEPVPAETVAALRRCCERVAVVRLGRWTRWASALGSLLCGGTVTEGAFRSAGLRAVVRQWAAQTAFAAAVASASSMVPYLREAALRDVPAVVDSRGRWTARSGSTTPR